MSRLCSSSPSVSNQIVRSETLPISPTRENYEVAAFGTNVALTGFAMRPMVIEEVVVFGVAGQDRRERTRRVNR